MADNTTQLGTFTVASEPEELKRGKSKKGRPWILRKITLQGSDLEPAGFDAVKIGDQVEVTEKETEEGYINHNYSKVKKQSASTPAPATAPAPTAGADPRVLKLLVLVAEAMGTMQEQVGVSDEDILTKEQILEVMER